MRSSPRPGGGDAGEAARGGPGPAAAGGFVNGAAPTSKGADRHFVSRGLSAGMTYSYKLRVEFERDGQTVVENKQVRLQPGQTATLAFGAESSVAAAEPAKTELKVSVPAEAKVYLAGAETSQTGESRTFATDRLAAGQTWDGYVVRVELTRDGQKIVKEETLSIEGGQSYELAFTFDEADTRIASVR